MSNIGNKTNTFGKTYNITVTNGTEEQLSSLGKVNLYNSIIISIPQENGKDIVGDASLWMTDSDGNLLQICQSINKINSRLEALETIIGNQ